MIDLRTPISEEQVRQLRVGDVVAVSGTVVTARDAAHKYMVEQWIEGTPAGDDAALLETLRPVLAGGVIYHCGPVVRQDESGRWHFVAAGPTTSSREEPYEHKVIGALGVRAVIGKGGMGDLTLGACAEHGAVYLHAVGGAATLIAQRVREVEDVYKMEFGLPEAFWRIRVEDFQCVVTMDSHGGSLHKEVLEKSRRRYREIMGG
jgi:fumarate hydratase subunit beta